MLAGLTACGSTGGSGSANQTGGTQSSSGGEIDIGLIADLTGPAALSGQHKVQGAELAVDEINASGGINGKKIKLITEDDQGSNQAGVSAFQKLAANQNIVAI